MQQHELDRVRQLQQQRLLKQRGMGDLPHARQPGFGPAGRALSQVSMRQAHYQSLSRTTEHP